MAPAYDGAYDLDCDNICLSAEAEVLNAQAWCKTWNEAKCFNATPRTPVKVCAYGESATLLANHGRSQFDCLGPFVRGAQYDRSDAPIGGGCSLA